MVKNNLLYGFIDTHSHLLLYGLFKELVDVRPETIKNISDIKSIETTIT